MFHPNQIKNVIDKPLELAKYYHKRDYDPTSEMNEDGGHLECNTTDISDIHNAGVILEAYDTDSEHEDCPIVLEDSSESESEDSAPEEIQDNTPCFDWAKMKHIEPDDSGDEVLDVVDSGPTELKRRKQERINKLRMEFWDNESKRKFGLTKPDNTVVYVLKDVFNKNGSRKKHPADKILCDFCHSVFRRSHVTKHRRTFKHRQACKATEAMIQAQLVTKGKKFCIIPEDRNLDEYLIEKIKKELIKSVNVVDGKIVVRFI